MLFTLVTCISLLLYYVSLGDDISSSIFWPNTIYWYEVPAVCVKKYDTIGLKQCGCIDDFLTFLLDAWRCCSLQGMYVRIEPNNLQDPAFSLVNHSPTQGLFVLRPHKVGLELGLRRAFHYYLSMFFRTLACWLSAIQPVLYSIFFIFVFFTRLMLNL